MYGGLGCFVLGQDQGPIAEQWQVLPGAIEGRLDSRAAGFPCRPFTTVFNMRQGLVGPAALGELLRPVEHEAGFLVERAAEFQGQTGSRSARGAGHVDPDGVVQKDAINGPSKEKHAGNNEVPMIIRARRRDS